MHVHSPIFQGQLKENNDVEKRVKKWKEYFFVLNKYQSMTDVSTCIFQGFFKDIVFRSVALVTNKLWAVLDFFFTGQTFSALYPSLKMKKKLFFSQKNLLNYYSLKVTKFTVIGASNTPHPPPSETRLDEQLNNFSRRLNHFSWT